MLDLLEYRKRPPSPRKAPTKDILSTYRRADRTLLINEDDEILKTIKVPLPAAPALPTIDNYGLYAKNQFFTKAEMPPRLKSLEKRFDSIEQIWEFLSKHASDYEDEVEWIEEQWYRIINGYWVYINGRPTYIDGWHYMYLNFWHIDVGTPEYRSRDRKFFLFARFCYTDQIAFYPVRVQDPKTKEYNYFANEDVAKKFLRSKKVEWEIEFADYTINMGVRICYGFNYPKHRREGATYKANEINFIIAITNSIVGCGIQSMDGTSAEKAFSKAIVKPWRRLPFFLKPQYSGSTNPKKKLDFDIPSSMAGGLSNIEIGLESWINFAESQKASAYDGDKLACLNNDECGKTMGESVDYRWQIQKKCLAQGNGRYINGFAINTSTVGEMSDKGGMSFYKLCKKSHYEARNDTGQTESGLYNLFIPAYDGLEGFIDMFGDSIIDDPRECDTWRIPGIPYRDKNKQLRGARNFLQGIRDEILLREDEDSLGDYEEEVRLHPHNFSECFITAGKNSGFDLKKITKRLKELQFDRIATERGDFEWLDNIPDTRVIWVPNDISGKWYKSLEIDHSQTNRKNGTMGLVNGKNMMIYTPDSLTKFTASADPYKFRETQGMRRSKGGGAVRWNRDKEIDPDTKPIEEWKSRRTVCTYSNRLGDIDQYCEDMLMMSIYWGAMMFPEINVPRVWDHFINRGYGGYLKYYIGADGVIKKTPGFNMAGAMPEKIMAAIQSDIKHHCHRERHIEVLLEAKAIKGPEDLTHNDLLVAVGGTIMGEESDYSGFENRNNNNNADIGGYF